LPAAVLDERVFAAAHFEVHAIQCRRRAEPFPDALSKVSLQVLPMADEERSIREFQDSPA
jgi:hypothetical protein